MPKGIMFFCQVNNIILKVGYEQKTAIFRAKICIGG